MKPVYKIETWTGGVLDHTITDEAITWHTKDVLTDGVGHFSFTVPAKTGSSYKYDDIAVNDIVKIYHDYKTVPGTPNFTGRVAHISGVLSTATGWVRQISGLSFGEILLRRQKKNKIYNGTGASTIVTLWATELGILGVGDIEGDGTAVDLTVQSKSYFDLLKWISDYWANAGSQIKKDFWVHTDNHLHWKSRPIRTVGVETLTVGDNIIDYSVDYLVDKVKNYITVYGAKDKKYPLDGDMYTEQAAAETPANDGWSGGTLSWNADATVGNESVQSTAAAVLNYDIFNSFPGEAALDCDGRTRSAYSFLHFWINLVATPNPTGQTLVTLQLYCPDVNNRFNLFIPSAQLSDAKWFDFTFPVGHDSDWTTLVGSPDWNDVQSIRFYISGANNGNFTTRIDGFYFGGRHYENLAQDAASIAAYGQRDLTALDEKLYSDGECQKRAETLLYQLKDLPTQITVTVVGNNNILIGDRIPMTIPAENISAANYDVVAVENSLSPQGYKTKATMVNSVNIRTEMNLTPTRTLAKIYEAVKALNINELTVK